jgi:hypothetical protein
MNNSGTPMSMTALPRVDHAMPGEQALLGIEAIDDFVGDDVTRFRFGAIERLRQRKDLVRVAAPRDTVLTVTLEHQTIEQTKLVEQFDADIPVHTQKRVATHLDARCAAARRHRSEHGQHVRATQPECQKVRVEHAAQIVVAACVACHLRLIPCPNLDRGGTSWSQVSVVNMRSC